MSSLPPFGGSSRRSHFAVLAVPPLSLPIRSAATRLRFASMGVQTDGIVADDQSAIFLAAQRRSVWQQARRKSASFALLTILQQVEA